MTRPIDAVVRSDAVVVGGGVAGLTTALALGSTTVLTKGAFGSGGSTEYAQGGIAAALGADDDAGLHAADTMAVAGGLADAVATGLLTGGAAERIRWLVDLGARFDRAGDGTIALGREAGHTRRRIVHADGDATGAELMRTLSAAVRARPDVDVVEHALAVDLIRSGGRVVGVLVRRADGRLIAHLAPAVVLATGGLGRVYARTTNPVEVTGDGIAMAARAGAVLADLEFVQFHPTALDAGVDPMPLLTEALRGEGALLIDGAGDRFMCDVHPDAELAPRDVVARAIWRRLDAGDPVYLDARRVAGDDFPRRFPTVFGFARAAGLDPRTDLLPVSPAAHYHMGGIAVDADGRSSLPGLWACGEASSTGVHGANRLASNSLLEGLVFGARVADSIRRRTEPLPTAMVVDVPARTLTALGGPDGETVTAIRETMWRHAGIVRDRTGLVTALGLLHDLAGRAATIEAQNLVEVARLVVGAALAREESRGGHYRADFPGTDPHLAARSRRIVRPAEATTFVVDARRVAASDAA